MRTQDNARYRRLVGGLDAHVTAPLQHLFVAGCTKLAETQPQLLLEGSDEAAAGRVGQSAAKLHVHARVHVRLRVHVRTPPGACMPAHARVPVD